MTDIVKQSVYKSGKLQLSERRMADFMYAIVITRSQVTRTFGIGIYNLKRGQNCHNMVDFIISIPEDKIEEFERLSGTALGEIQTAQPN